MIPNGLMFHNDSNLDSEDGGDCRNLSVFVVKKTGVTPISPIENQNHQEQMHIEPIFSNSIINVSSRNEMPPAPAVTRFDELASNHSSSTPSSRVQHSKKTFVVEALVEGIPKTSISTYSNRDINVSSRNATRLDDLASNQSISTPSSPELNSKKTFLVEDLVEGIPKTSISSIRTINVKEMPKLSTHSNQIINIVSGKVTNQITNDITKTSTYSIRTINVKEMSKESTYSDRIINIVSSKK